MMLHSTALISMTAEKQTSSPMFHMHVQLVLKLMYEIHSVWTSVMLGFVHT